MLSFCHSLDQKVHSSFRDLLVPLEALQVIPVLWQILGFFTHKGGEGLTIK